MAFWLLLKLRIAEVWRRPSTGFFFLFFPLVIFLVIFAVFWNGHPFEKKEIVFLSFDKPTETLLQKQLSSFSELRFSSQPPITLEVAKEQLRGRAISAVLVNDPTPTLYVSEQEALFGQGLAAIMPGATLSLVETPRFSYLRYLFPGFLAWSIVLSGLLGMGSNLVKYRQNLFLKKLATTPMPKSSFVLAQLLSRAVLVLSQGALLLLVAWFLLGLSLSLSTLLLLSAVIFLGLFVFSGLGFLFACFITTEEIYIDFLNTIAPPLLFLSEIFFSTSVLPSPLSEIANALPSTQLVRLTRSILLYGDTSSWWIYSSWLLLWALFAYVISVWRFRWTQ